MRCDQTALRVRTIDVVKLVELVQGIGLRRNTCEKAGEHAGGEHTARAAGTRAVQAVHSAYDARRAAVSSSEGSYLWHTGNTVPVLVYVVLYMYRGCMAAACAAMQHRAAAYPLRFRVTPPAQPRPP